MFRLFISAAALALCSCQSLPSHGVNHTVILWLKEPGNAAQRQKLIETAQGFRAIPGVRSVTAGPCIPGPRAIVDSTFDVAVTLTFDSPEALQRYVDHPLHKAAADSVLKPLVKKITVFDSRY